MTFVLCIDDWSRMKSLKYHPERFLPTSVCGDCKEAFTLIFITHTLRLSNLSRFNKNKIYIYKKASNIDQEIFHPFVAVPRHPKNIQSPVPHCPSRSLVLSSLGKFIILLFSPYRDLSNNQIQKVSVDAFRNLNSLTSL